MGFVIVLVDAPFAGWDGVPDPLGWALVVAGLLALRGRLPGTDTVLGVAVLCGLVALATYPPAVADQVGANLGWLLSLPQIAFCILLCNALYPLAEAQGGGFRVLRWVFVALAVAPVLVFGGGVDVLATPTGGLAVLADLYFTYLVFRVSKRPFALP